MIYNWTGDYHPLVNDWAESMEEKGPESGSNIGGFMAQQLSKHCMCGQMFENRGNLTHTMSTINHRHARVSERSRYRYTRMVYVYMRMYIRHACE